MKRAARVLVFAGITVLALLMACIAIGFLTGDFSRPERWEIPSSYRGWLTIYYDNPRCPALTTDGIYKVTRLDSRGQACTSDSMPDGWRYIRYYLVSADGSEKKIKGGLNWGEAGTQVWDAGGISNDHTWEHAFVGTEKELNSSWDTQPKP